MLCFSFISVQPRKIIETKRIARKHEENAEISRGCISYGRGMVNRHKHIPDLVTDLLPRHICAHHTVRDPQRLFLVITLGIHDPVNKMPLLPLIYPDFRDILP